MRLMAFKMRFLRKLKVFKCALWSEIYGRC